MAGVGSIPAGPRGYALACVLSLASAAARGDASMGPAERDARAERLSADAIRRLGEARAADFFGGPAGLNRIEDDPDLDPLRARGDFQLLRMDLAFPNDPFARAG